MTAERVGGGTQSYWGVWGGGGGFYPGLSWLTNSAHVIEPKCGGKGGGELQGLSPQCIQLYTGAQINFGDLTPYLNNSIPTVGWETSLGPETQVDKITSVPVTYMALGLNDFDVGKSITRAIGRGRP